MKIDLHVHSEYSKRPSQWILQKIGCSESFTKPAKIYDLAKSRGMTHFTISDHNTIDGALEIAHLPNTFISEEITTYFPGDQCKIHVLALNINEKQHGDIQKIRENVFDLSTYLHKEKIFSIVAHPLYAINERLKVDHFEQLLLLFDNFELNGARNDRENEILRSVINTIDTDVIISLANKYDLCPVSNASYKKRLLGGSDDHSSLNIARTYTSIQGIDSIDTLIKKRETLIIEVISDSATPQTMAHNLYSIAYQFYENKFNLGKFAEKDHLMNFLDRSLKNNSKKEKGLLSKIYFFWSYRKDKDLKNPISQSLTSLLRSETKKLLKDNPQLIPSDDSGKEDFKEKENRWFNFVNLSSNRVISHFGDHILDHLSGTNVFNIFQSIGSAGGLYTLLVPYFVAFSQFSKDKSFSEKISNHFFSNKNGYQTPSPFGVTSIGHFTDTFYEVNGVALTLQQHVRMAIKHRKELTVITCAPKAAKEKDGIKNFSPIGTYRLPEYPAQKLFYPPLLEMLTYCYEKNFNQIHTATPGPIGLAALAVARILKIPISGTYHTSIPQYAQILTKDDTIEDLAWKYILWYYGQLDVIYAPSNNTKNELVQKGLNKDKIRIYPRGIDIVHFHPNKKNGWFGCKTPLKEGFKFLYVGRISKEKNLHLLTHAFKTVYKTYRNARLIVVGDGPYLEEMKVSLKGYPCFFTGFLDRDHLPQVYASCDIFVFPSTTDTFGNVVLEAQACGLPVIVTDKGGPCENLIPDITGLIIKGDEAAHLIKGMLTCLENPQMINRFKEQARQYMEDRSFDSAFMRIWQMYDQKIQTEKNAAA